MRLRTLTILVIVLSFMAACAASDTTSDGEPTATTTRATASSVPPTPSVGVPITEPAPSTEPTPFTKQWVDLQVGECVAEVPAVDVGVATVKVVDCASPHQAEVYLLAPVAVDAAIANVAGQACAAGVEEYTGGGGSLSVTYLIDSKQDRTGAIPLPSTVICLLQSAGGAPLTGSVRG